MRTVSVTRTGMRGIFMDLNTILELKGAGVDIEGALRRFLSLIHIYIMMPVLVPGLISDM